jgi:hypothetical protein
MVDHGEALSITGRQSHPCCGASQSPKDATSFDPRHRIAAVQIRGHSVIDTRPRRGCKYGGRPHAPLAQEGKASMGRSAVNPIHVHPVLARHKHVAEQEGSLLPARTLLCCNRGPRPTTSTEAAAVAASGVVRAPSAVPLLCLALVELIQRLDGDAPQQLAREDAQQRPGQV